MPTKASSVGKCEEKGEAEQVCGNYTTITDRKGRNALKGAVAFEGYGACKLCPSLHLPAFTSARHSLQPSVSQLGIGFDTFSSKIHQLLEDNVAMPGSLEFCKSCWGFMHGMCSRCETKHLVSLQGGDCT